MIHRIRLCLAEIGPAEWALAVWCALMAGVLVGWMVTNTAPPPWDESWYLQTSVVFFHALHAGSLGEFVRLVATSFGGTKAPLISLLPLPAYVIGGLGYGSIIVTNVVIALVGWIALFLYARSSLGPWRALVVVMIFTMMPVSFGIARQFLVETSLTDLVILWMLLLQRSNLLTTQRRVARPLGRGAARRLAKAELSTTERYDVWLGVVLGLGMLSKVDFPLYVAVPTLLALISTGRRQYAISGHTTVWRQVVKVLLIGLIVCSVWYGPNLLTVTHYALSAGFGKIAGNYSYGNPFSPATIAYYLQTVVNYGTSVYIGTAFILVVLGLLVTYRRDLWKRIVAKQGGVHEILWLTVPLLIFLFGVNKDYRFLLPLLPAVALLLVRGASALIRSTRLRVALLAVALIGPLGLMVETSVAGQPVFASETPGGFAVMSPYLGYATQPVVQHWPLKRILLTIEVNASRRYPPSGPPPLVLLVVDNPYFNQNNMSYYAAVMNLPLNISAVETSSPSGETYALSYISQAQYLITKTGDQGPTFTTYLNAWIRSELKAGRLPFSPIDYIAMPDGSTATVYVRDASAGSAKH